jgi:tetratricopeptide (TPR) repeat protein
MAFFSQSSHYRQSHGGRIYLSYLGKGGAPLLLVALSFLALLLFQSPSRIIGVVAGGYALGALPLLALSLRHGRRDTGPAKPESPPIRHSGSRAPWIPASTEPFIGRSRELRLIEEFLEQPRETHPQIVVITGPPGTGKTSLAAQAALRAAETHSDGQAFVQFDARLEPGKAAKAALSSLIADLHGSHEDLPSSLDELKKAFTAITANQSLIIIADGISEPEFAHTIMSAGPKCLVFITAEHLTLKPARALLVDLGALQIPDALAVLETKLGAERMNEEPEAAQAIVKAAGLNLLAIRLIGSSIAEGPYWSLALAYERLIQKTQIPDNNSHGSMTSAGDALSIALEISYDRLAEDERTAVSLLALLDTPVFSPWMLAALLGAQPGATSKIIDGLLRASLLERVSADATGVPLFRTRQQVLNCAERKLLTNTDQRYREERRARLAHAQEQRHRADISRSTTGAILLMQEEGDFSNALAKARDAIALSRDQEDPPSEALALAALAEIQAELGYTGEADELAEAAWRIGGQDSRPRALRVLGKVRRRWRQLEASEKYLKEGLQLAESNNDSPEVTRILRELAAVQAEGVAPDASLETARRAIEAASQQYDTMPLLIAGSRWVEGRALLRTKQYDDAERTLRRALDDALHSRQRMWQAWIYHELGRVEFERSGLTQAQEHANDGLSLFAAMRHRYGVAYCRMLLGEIYFKGGHLNDASRVLAEAFDTFQNCGDPWIEAEASRMLAKVRASQDRSRDAIRLLDNAAATFAELDDLTSLGRVQLERAASKWRWVFDVWHLISSRVGAGRSARR